MRNAGYFSLLLLSFGVAAYALAVYALLPLGAAVHPEMRPTFTVHRTDLIYAHIFGSVFALALGPLQFRAQLRASRPALHRWSGRLYLAVGVLLGGLAGLLVSFNAAGGLPARLGFGSLAVAWLYTGLRAWLAIRARDFEAHRRWMVRNFALTFAAVTLRLWLPGMVIAGVSFSTAYATVGWLCWIPNLAVAEWWFNRRRNAGLRLVAGA